MSVFRPIIRMGAKRATTLKFRPQFPALPRLKFSGRVKSTRECKDAVARERHRTIPVCPSLLGQLAKLRSCGQSALLRPLHFNNMTAIEHVGPGSHQISLTIILQSYTFSRDAEH